MMKKSFFGGKQAPPFGAKKGSKSESKETDEDEKKESAKTQKKEADAGVEEDPSMANKYGLKKVAKANKMKARYSKAGSK